MKTFQPAQDHALVVLAVVVIAALFCYTGALIKGVETKGLFEITLVALGGLSGYARRDNTSSTLQLIEAVRAPVAASPVLPEAVIAEAAPRKRTAKKESE